MIRKHEQEVIAFVCIMGMALIIIAISFKNIWDHC